VRIRNIVHKGLNLLFTEGNSRGVPPNVAEKLQQMLTFLNVLEQEHYLRTVAPWKAHLLTGDRKGTWSLFVTKNWRLTFRIEGNQICDLDFEDYH
jgi:proteic killer suppression protein